MARGDEVVGDEEADVARAGDRDAHQCSCSLLEAVAERVERGHVGR